MIDKIVRVVHAEGGSTPMTLAKEHDCDFCRRHRAVEELLSRIENEADRKLIADISERLSCIEDDQSYDRVVLSAYREKFGPLGFAESCKILDEAKKGVSTK